MDLAKNFRTMVVKVPMAGNGKLSIKIGLQQGSYVCRDIISLV